MNTVIQLLIKADNALASISVKGDDAFALVDARRLLKAAFDELRKEDEPDDPNV
ncbi:MAG: hypothetical protein J6Y20_01085 [Lachnospiraceae bacterium]|nr:hypothetical protein [Lachnospiraceae bacterium]